MSRAFGDYTFKKSGVISVPEIHRVQITPQHRFSNFFLPANLFVFRMSIIINNYNLHN